MSAIGPIVLYVGPSNLDGAPIVALASLESSNRKTGRLIQTWIMRADMLPTEASHGAHDDSVCGACPRRRSIGGDCYVLIHNAPQSAWKAWERAGSPGENWTEERAIVALTNEARDYGLRLGSYGDPAAVPSHVWGDLIAAIAPKMIVGYTHQWRTTPDAWFRNNLMASCDSVQDADDARALGWRFFVALAPDVQAPDRSFNCTADAKPGASCATCGACNGSQGRPSRASVWIREHGAMSEAKHSRARRAAALQVVA